MVYVCGSNNSQRLGLGIDVKDVRQPTLVEELNPSICKDSTEKSFLNKVMEITAAGAMTFAVTSSGHVFSWGCNNHGALGLGAGVKSVAKPHLL